VLTEKPQGRRRLGSVTRSAAQARVLDAALGLFTERGVSGTSLQMIADAVGVTKAAVYHQFRTKEEIVIAVTDAELGKLEDALEAAEAEDDPLRARKVLLTRVIDMAIDRRGAVRTLQSDPVIIRLLGEHAPFQRFISRLYGVLLDEDDDTDARISAALLSGAIAGGIVSPIVDDVDDATLKAAVLQLTRRMLNLPE
jgi:AcrR family transcriptional regulator